MGSAGRYRYVIAATLSVGLLAAALFGVACQPMTHDGIEVSGEQCISCHRKDFEATREPLHIDTLPETCGECHDEEAWAPASRFGHDKHFVLRGTHAKTQCKACHTKGYDSGDTPSTCVDCHRSDYERAVDPSHADYSIKCESCHDEAAWRPAPNFAHDWPLTGAHERVVCAGCHMGDPPKYEGTGNTCVSCHRMDYDRSPFPGHASFATTCQDCHMTTGWTPASGGHPESRFPIKSGKHTNVACATCHNAALAPAAKDNIDCVGCHEHRRSKMDEVHHEESKYPKGDAPPEFCLSCHPDGRKHDD
jgi:Cytochrome c7 and related cytochrome c/Doubled CXXCH motif (Paired_CXXCH_1)